jgi:hypothetical protein
MERELCDRAAKGELCHHDILRLMSDVEAKPDKYPGLEPNASLNSLQAFLYNHGRCPESCSGNRSNAGEHGVVVARGGPARERRSHGASVRRDPGTAEAARGIDRLRGREARRFSGTGKGRHEKEEEEEKDQEACKQLTPDSVCLKHVEWVLNVGLFTHPDWYTGLSKESTFQDVQAALQKDPRAECPAPCECHTARPGEACYDKVSWVLETGFVDHPEWYPGLTGASTRKEVQAMLQKQFNGSPANSCQKPCNR